MMGLFSALGRTLPPEGFRMWYSVLKDLPLDKLQQAIVVWLAESDSGFPTPAALRKRAAEFEHGSLLGSDEAFLLVTRALQQHSPYYAPREFCQALPPMVRQAVESCGGPSWIADLGIENRTTYAAQFRRAYEAIAERADRTRRLPESLRPRPALASHAPAVARLAEALSLPSQSSAVQSSAATGAK